MLYSKNPVALILSWKYQRQFCLQWQQRRSLLQPVSSMKEYVQPQEKKRIDSIAVGSQNTQRIWKPKKEKKKRHGSGRQDPYWQRGCCYFWAAFHLPNRLPVFFIFCYFLLFFFLLLYFIFLVFLSLLTPFFFSFLSLLSIFSSILLFFFFLNCVYKTTKVFFNFF